jgi:signal transduction histidine kinase
MRRGLRVRTRLTLLYGALFLVGGALLVAGMVLLVRGFLFADLPASRLDLAKLQIGDAADKLDLVERVRAEVRDQAVRRLLWSAGAGLVVVTALAGAVGGVMAGRMLARLRKVTEAAQAASETSLHRRLNLPGPRDELKELGDTFDAMLARLDEAFAAQRRFVANASHELRTPLSVTRAAVEVTLAKPNATNEQLRAMGEEVAAAMVKAQRLVDSLLLLARSEQRAGEAERDDLADLAAEALDAVRREADARALKVLSELEPAPVAGDLALLSRAVANLVENAVRHNRDHGEVAVASGVDGAQAWVEVRNTGRTLSPAEVERLFEPFHRGERTRLDGDGVGLGLSIVEAVAAAHGGTVTARARPAADGGGLRVTLRLAAEL